MALVTTTATNVLAAPVRGSGQAPLTGEAGQSGHQLALRRARIAALTAALDATGPIDAATRERVLGQAEVWTGAYRVLSQSDDGATVSVHIEVDIDAGRLAKRVRPPTQSTAAVPIGLGRVVVGPECPPLAVTSASVEQTALTFGLRTTDDPRRRVDFTVTCRVLGPVSYTHLRAASVRIEGVSGHDSTTAVADGFAGDDHVALAIAAERALARVVGTLSETRRGTLLMSIEAPVPAAAVRRLQRAMGLSVAGVEGVELAGIEPDGTIALRVTANLAAQELGSRLLALSSAGISVTIVRVPTPDTLVVRLH